jgi:hypothetical protein
MRKETKSIEIMDLSALRYWLGYIGKRLDQLSMGIKISLKLGRHS